MRVSIWAILMVAAALTAAPARAQTYDPKYPVCLEVVDGEGGYTECTYSSLQQCAQSAVGRPAQCMVNPFFAGGAQPASPPGRPRRP
jgi:Protein of unknown function (DUF3551)